MEDSLVFSQRKTGPPTPGGFMSVSDSPSKASPGKSVSFKINESPHRSLSPSTRLRSVPGDMGSPGRVRSVPGDMVKSDRSLPTTIRQPPNPGGIDMLSSPSPGGRPKRAPSPGTFSPAPPNLAVASQSGSDDNSLNKTTTTTTQQRFIFTKNPTGVVPPSSLSVSSSVQNYERQKGTRNLDSSESIPNQNAIESPVKQKEFKSSSSKKKTPIGHSFLQKMNWSDSDESDEDDLEVYSQSKLSEHSSKDKGKSSHLVNETMTKADQTESNKLMADIKKSNGGSKIFEKFNQVTKKPSESSDVETKKEEIMNEPKTTTAGKVGNTKNAPVTHTDTKVTEDAPKTDSAKILKDDSKELINAKLDRNRKNVDPSFSSSKLSSVSTSKSSKMAFLSKAKSLTKHKENITGHSSLHTENSYGAKKVSSTSKKTVSKELISQKLDITKKIENDSSITRPKLQSSFSSDNSIGSTSSSNLRSRREQLDRVKKKMVRGRSPSPALTKVTLSIQDGSMEKSRVLSQSDKKNPYAVDKNVIAKSNFNIRKISTAVDTKKNSSTRRPPIVSVPSDDITSLETKMNSNADRVNILREKASKLRDRHQVEVKVDNSRQSSEKVGNAKSFENQFHHLPKIVNPNPKWQDYQQEIDSEHMEQYAISSLPRKSVRVYSGAYSDLLPWSTTPLIFRMYEPTLPNSLVRHADSSADEMNQGAILDMKAANSIQDGSEQIPTNTFSVGDQDAVLSPNTQDASYVSLAKETTVKPASFESDEGSENIKTSNSDHNEIQDQTQMISTANNIENQNVDVAEWWDQSYAHSQDEEVNQDVMEALSNSMNRSLDTAKEGLDVVDKYTEEQCDNKEEESDDDVFDGLDSYPSPLVTASKMESKPQIDDIDDILGRAPKSPDTESKEKATKNSVMTVHLNNSIRNRGTKKEKPVMIENKAVHRLDKYHNDRAFDDLSNSSRSSRSDSNDSAIADTMRLSKKERRKWKDWDQRDNASVESKSVYSSDYTNDSKHELFERRSRAHEKLLLHADTALSRPPHAIPVEKEVNTTKISLGMDQRQMLEKFCTQIKISPLEVLKLTRESKWQTRFLTTSKEGSWLKNGNGMQQGDAAFCPLGILWVKKLSKTHDYSISKVDNQGRGGGLFAHLTRFSIRNDLLRQYSLTKKQSAKFRECVVVTLYFDGEHDFSVTFACSKSSAEVITTGCCAVIDILRPDTKHIPLQQAVPKQIHQKTFLQQGLVPKNNVKAPAVKVTTKKEQRTAVVAKSLSNHGAPHLWEA